MTVCCESPSCPRPATARATPARSKGGPRNYRSRWMETALRCQRVLETHPTHPGALLGISMVALASRQPEAAVQTAAAATEAAPDKIEAWLTLGQALKAASRFEEAEKAYLCALRLDGMHPLTRLGLGELRLASGAAAEALAEFEQARRRQPTLAAAYLGAGNALAFLGRYQEALDRYRQAAALTPRAPEVHFAAGFALAHLYRIAEAEARYRRALWLRPDFAAAWMNLGVLLREQDRTAEAQAALRRAAELRPDMISAWLNLALLERDRGRNGEAEKHLRRAFALDPSAVDTLLAWCQLRIAEKDMAGAWQWLHWALAQEPDGAEALNTYGILLHGEGRFEEAIAVFERAEASEHHAASSNRGNALIEARRLDEALAAHEKAVALDPRSAGAEYNLALTRLRVGDWARGWPGYEARWRFREVHHNPIKFAQPRWRGEPLRGRRVLLHADQGLGDTMQFCRYAPLVAARGGTPVLIVQKPVERLVCSLAVVRSGKAEVVSLAAGAAHPKRGFDLECPLMSLPAVFGTTIRTAPWPGPYLAADPDETRRKFEEFPDLNPGLRIGIAWAGNPKYKADAVRSTRLATLLPLLRGVEANWITLQKGEAAEQIGEVPDGVPLRDGSSRDRDLAETAALVATLDLVITTDTSIAHLAGAMGKPVWILLAYVADWRWMEGIETTPWYPTARLFRQAARGDWAGVLERVRENLERLRAEPA